MEHGPAGGSAPIRNARPTAAADHQAMERGKPVPAFRPLTLARLPAAGHQARSASASDPTPIDAKAQELVFHEDRRRFSSAPTEAAAAGGAAGGSFPELTFRADFAAVAAPGSRISVVVFGSLLSGSGLVAERSARSTFPEVESFDVTALRGFRWVFAHSATIFFDCGIAVEATKVVPEGLDGVLFTN